MRKKRGSAVLLSVLVTGMLSLCACHGSKETKAFTEITERIYRNYPQLVELLDNQSEQYNGACQELEQLQEQGKLLMLCPSGSISVSAIEGDMERLGALYLLGRADAKLMLPQIRAYFGLATEKAE